MRALSNAKWVAVSQFSRIGSQLANLFVLAKILPPHDYGLMAMASMVTTFAFLLRDQGTSAVLIQKEEINHNIINTVFWFNVLFATCIAFGIILASPLISRYFNQPGLEMILIILALIFPVSGSTISHQALLERKSEFKKLAIIDINASLIAMGVAIVFALMGAGVYSLVIQAVLMVLITSGQLWFVSEWRPKGKPVWRELKALLPFTGHMSAYQFISYFSSNADTMIIGRLLGASPLGVYSMAYRIMMFPVQNITYASIRALLPIMSRQQSALEEMGALYLQALKTISLITAPLMGLMFALREPFVMVIFGAKWSGVADVLTWLAIVGFIQSISYASGTVLMAQGRAKLLMQLAIFSSLVHVIAFVLGSSHGIVGVAQYYFYASLVVGGVFIFTSAFKCHLTVMKTLSSFMPQVMITLLTVLVVQKLLEVWAQHHKTDLFLLAYLFMIGFAIQVLMYTIFFRQEMTALAKKLYSKRLPA